MLAALQRPWGPILDRRAETGSKRDRRLDLFRGLALIFIFVDHIRGNPLGWFTIRNYGFSDATEIFVFISGYSAARAYGMSAAGGDFLFTSARIWRRCWQLYVAHILLFIIFATHVASVSARFGNPMFAEEMNVASFLRDPEATLLQVLLLRFRPLNMDVLPLYIVLLLAFPLILPLLKRLPWVTLALSAALWQCTRAFDINFHTYPSGGVWFFDPSAWQLLFVLGALTALRPEIPARIAASRRWLDIPVAAFLTFALVVVLGWKFPAVERLLPQHLLTWMYPIDKTALDPLRLIHFLCVAYAAARFIAPESPVTRLPPLRPLVVCGRHSLEIFCLGTLLSLSAMILLGEARDSLVLQLATAATGIAVMIGAAGCLDWYQRREKDLSAARRGGNP